MNKTKAILTVLALLAALVWVGAETSLPLPGVIEDVFVGIVGVVGLALGSVFRAFGTVGAPLAALLRVLAVPLALGLIAYLMLRELRQFRS